MTDIKELDRKYIANTYARFPLTLARGEGSLLYDEAGREYIDMGAGIGVNIFGVCDGEWQRAVTEQLSALQHASNLYYTGPCARLAQKLCERTGMSRAFFANSGAEVNECAIKAARKYAAEKCGPGCFNIITLKNSFHGRTLTTLAATGQERFHELFQPLTPGFLCAEAEDMDGVRALAEGGSAAAVMIECVQGEGGVIPLSKPFVRELARFAAQNDILLIVDEVQSGNGRTGELYAYMNYDISPDIVTTAKGLGGGLPIGACLLSEKLRDVFSPGDNGSTFGGNPVCCAGAISVLDRIDGALLEGVKARSAFLTGELSGAPGITGVYGMGLMLGVDTARPVGEMVSACMERGVLCLTAKSRLRLLPALNIPMELLQRAAAVIKEAAAGSL